MTKEELNNKTSKELTPTENALINFNIYFNPDHVDYWIRFKMEDYQWCYDYLMENRHLLTIENTPKGYKTKAKQNIRAMKKLMKRK